MVNINQEANKPVGKYCIGVLDIGTSSIKCGVVDGSCNVICHTINPIKITGEEFFSEIDFMDLFDSTINRLTGLINEAYDLGYVINAIVIVSQANTFVPVDEALNPLRNGILWLDDRAKEEAHSLQSQLPDFPIWSGLSVIKPTHYISKILWLKKNEPEMFRNCRYFPLANEFFFLRFTHRYFSEYSNRGMSCMFDIRNISSRKDVRDILSMSEETEPVVGPACGMGQLITGRMQSLLGLSNPVPVYLAGNDQSSSAIGAGLEKPGDLSVTFGTTQTFYTLVNELPEIVGSGEVYGKSPVPPYYFHIKFEENCGFLIEKMKSIFFPAATYEELFEVYQKEMVKPTPYYVQLKRKIGKQDIVSCRYDHGDPFRAMEEAVDSIISNFLQTYILYTSYNSIDRIFFTGGLTQSPVWCSILSCILERDVIVTEKRNAGLVGAAKIYYQNSKSS